MRLCVEQLEARLLLSGDQPLNNDVNGDGYVTPADVIVLINAANISPQSVKAVRALSVINDLNLNGVHAAEGEGFPVALNPTVKVVIPRTSPVYIPTGDLARGFNTDRIMAAFASFEGGTVGDIMAEYTECQPRGSNWAYFYGIQPGTVKVPYAVTDAWQQVSGVLTFEIVTR